MLKNCNIFLNFFVFKIYDIVLFVLQKIFKLKG